MELTFPLICGLKGQKLFKNRRAGRIVLFMPLERSMIMKSSREGGKNQASRAQPEGLIFASLLQTVTRAVSLQKGINDQEITYVSHGLDGSCKIHEWKISVSILYKRNFPILPNV